jgi:phosphatidylglycerol:prolipoprotein diacylglycerol transferase
MLHLAYIPINIDPVIFYIGPLALRWYGLMYVVGILMGLWAIRHYTARKGISQDIVFRLLWWCIVAGLIGGRLYFVVQQPNFVSYYLAQPQHILATWEGGMAFFGALFVAIPVLFWRARAERINPLVALDAGALFAATGQIFGRIGNIINGDIVGYRSNLPWATLYTNPHSFFCQNLSNPALCGNPVTAVQPSAAYELLLNLVLLSILLFLAYRIRRPGLLMAIYLFGYCITQFFIFFVRDNIFVTFLGINGLKQAQWTSLIVFILLIPATFILFRISKPVPKGEMPATYGIPQKPKRGAEPKVIAEPAETVEINKEDEPVSIDESDEQPHDENSAETLESKEPEEIEGEPVAKAGETE